MKSSGYNLRKRPFLVAVSTESLASTVVTTTQSLATIAHGPGLALTPTCDNGLYGHNSDRLWVTKILRSVKYELRTCLNIRGTIVNGYRSKRLQFINAPHSSSTDAGQTSV